MRTFSLLSVAILIATCASPMMAQTSSEISEESTSDTHRTLKRKVAIGRFSNETQYGKGIFYNKANDPMGKQASDILASKLGGTGKFMLIERPDVQEMYDNGKLADSARTSIGADYVIVGSVTGFGRKTTGKSNLTTSSKSQTVEATVAIRLVDLSTGLVVYTDEGHGEASVTTKSNLTSKQRADFDATLGDKAINEAISQLVENIVSTCTDRPWRTYFLSVDGSNAIIAGGSNQGIQPGDTFAVIEPGKKVKNPQTGIFIELPGKRVGTVKVKQTGGETPETEYSLVDITEMEVTANPSTMIIEEI